MSDDYTQHQTLGEQFEAEKLSLEATSPPAEIAGYRMERFLGAGAYGQVWVALDLNTGRRVAVKFYLHRGGVNWSLLSREVKNLVALSADRHIVQVLEVGWDAEPPHYVMEFIENGSLEDMLRERPKLSVNRAVDLFRDICKGLNHTHGKGILHCDLKPANILLDEDFRPRLADFGQSRMSHEQTPALGTLFYMAPEQADLDSTPDVRWDVYGLGAILYRMLTGSAPHRDTELLEKIDTESSLPNRLAKYRDAICEAPPLSNHRNIAGVDRRLAAIIDRCLAADPDQRFSNVEQVVEAIEARDAAKSRRPLILLGIVGPLFLLIATFAYGSRTVRETGKQFTTALREQQARTNLSAAGEKAKSIEIELRSYFDFVRDEASQPAFMSAISETLADPDLKSLRRDIAERKHLSAARDKILDDQMCESLDDYLAERLRQNNRLAETSVGVPKLATMFVTDSAGTIIGIAYANPVSREKNSSGKNYAYRTYFTGKKNDLDKQTPSNDVDSIIGQTHLSTAFQSTATGLWKVAVSTPIRLPEVRDGTHRDESIDGVFVATTNFGDFEQFQVSGGEDEDEDVIGVLVDARSGPFHGTILQHPWMLEDRETASHQVDLHQVPKEMMDKLLAGGDFDYEDPIGSAHQADRYRGQWIAAVQPVGLPRRSAGDSTTTDLLVLVQFRVSKTVARVESLTNKLIAEGAIAVICMLLFHAGMWYVVRRASDSTPGDDLATGKSVPVALQETISIR